MKQLTFLSKLLFIALIASMVASCEDTGGGGGGGTFVLPPVIDLDSAPASTSIAAEEVFSVSIKADQGDNLMSTLTILEDGFELDANRINLLGQGFGAFSNPYTFTNSSEQASFAGTIDIISQSDASTRTYTFRVDDGQGNTDETTVDITTSTGPLSISFTEMSPFAWTDLILDQQGTIKFQINAAKGSSPMESLTVYEDGVAIADLTRLRLNTIDDLGGATNFDANPLGLLGDDQSAFSWVVWVTTHADNTTKNYTFKVTDGNGDSQEIGVNITVDAVTGTPITSDLTGKLLLNAGGPAGTGGIDLETGNGLGSSDPLSDLKDQGIDITQATSVNWIRKVAPVNGSILKTPGADFPFTGIGDIQFREEIQSAFDGGTTITESEVVLVGDVFIIQDAGGQIFIVEVTDVNETTSDNDDYYQLAIKR